MGVLRNYVSRFVTNENNRPIRAVVSLALWWLVNQVACWGDKDGSVAFCGNHLQSLNHRIGGFVLISCFVFDLFGALGDFKYQLIAVGVFVEQLVQDSSRAHWKVLAPRSFVSYTSQHTRCE